MKVFNVDMERALWRQLEVQVALSGMLIRDFTQAALEEALGDTAFDPGRYSLDEAVFRKNVRIPRDLWAKISLDAAEKDVSRRHYLNAAIAKKLRNTAKHVVVSQPGARKNLLNATAGKLSAEELVALFAQDLAQGDKRLADWLKEKSDSH